MMLRLAEVLPGGPPEGLPPSFAQQRLWFLDQPAPGDPSSNLVFPHRLSGVLDVSALRDAFTEVVARHEALRTRVVTTADGPRQVMAVHHIAADEWSMGVLESEISVLYRAFADGQPSPLAPLDIQYADFAQWQRSLLSDEVVDELLACRSVVLQAITKLLLPVMSVPQYAGPVTTGMIEVMILSGEPAIRRKETRGEEESLLKIPMPG